MKGKIFYFFLGNLFAALFIYLGLLDNNADFDKILRTRDIIWGIEIYLAIIVGMIVSSFRFQMIRSESDRSLNKFEKIFLVILSFSAFLGFAYMALIANIKLFDDPKKGFPDLLVTIIGIIAFWMVFVEYYFIEKKSTVKFTKIQKQIINLLTVFYVSSGIGLCWNTIIFEMYKDITTPLYSLLLILICLVILLPFQRHFWLEVMLSSKSTKDNVLVIVVLVLTIILAVIPVYLVNQL